MALSTGNTHSRSLIVAGSNQVQLARVGDVSGGRVQSHRVEVRETGQTRKVSGALYNETNFYIEQSRRYIIVSSKKMRTFVKFKWFPWIMMTVCSLQLIVLLTVTILLTRVRATQAVAVTCLVMSVLTGLSLVPTMAVYCQHLHVICWTLPRVLQLPVVPNMNTSNKHIEIAVSSLEGVYLSARNLGIGLMSETTGKVSFHVLSWHATNKIRAARNCSLILSVMTIICVIWVVPLIIVSIVRTVTAFLTI